MQASVIGADGEVMVLDMGEQVKIIDVANTLIEMSGRSDITIKFTGLRPGKDRRGSLRQPPSRTGRRTTRSSAPSMSTPL